MVKNPEIVACHHPAFNFYFFETLTEILNKCMIKSDMRLCRISFGNSFCGDSSLGLSNLSVWRIIGLWRDHLYGKRNSMLTVVLRLDKRPVPHPEL